MFLLYIIMLFLVIQNNYILQEINIIAVMLNFNEWPYLLIINIIFFSLFYFALLKNPLCYNYLHTTVVDNCYNVFFLKSWLNEQWLLTPPPKITPALIPLTPTTSPPFVFKIVHFFKFDFTEKKTNNKKLIIIQNNLTLLITSVLLFYHSFAHLSDIYYIDF